MAHRQRLWYMVVTEISYYQGGQRLRTTREEQGAQTVLSARALLQGKRTGQARGIGPPRRARDARGSVGGVALTDRAFEVNWQGKPGREVGKQAGEAARAMGGEKY